ncbi:MAG: minichromosome maintenance protein MCM, partial [Nanoarchaeota archaeon]|nr:minichromosome maintenance protein MCM [Nanoarchaeota archaeon]
DERQILELSQDPKVFEKLTKSIIPSVWGYDEIKRCLILQLFGGVEKTHADGQRSRGDIHILLIGDPGVAKSATLVFMAKISPKGRYVVGKSASGAGLTATVVRDEYLRGWSLEAGSMVLANRGLLCIDELEKMDPGDRSAMHEAMEQQTVTISKANVHATLRAETSVLAAANPKIGTFDPFQSIAQQIDLPPTLINRFDVIFPLRDLPNKEKDELIATHVLLEHRKLGEEVLISKELLRKYVAYAKQRVKPFLSDEAVEELKKFYVELRNTPVSAEGAVRPIPISARQLQALIRMSEASAKMRLSETVDSADAIRAIEIMKYYLMQVGYDYESKTFDIDRGTGGMPASQRNKVFIVRDVITQLESRLGKMIPVEEIEKELENKLTKDEIEEAITKLDTSGVVFRPRRGYVGRT